MTYILADQRQTQQETAAGFSRYRQYLAANQSRFPPGAYQIASSDWYFDPHDHRCPHDAWLESVAVSEAASSNGSENRTVAIRVRLLGAYHDGHIEFAYPHVFAYTVAMNDVEMGHRDWCYDEFRLTEAGRLVHEIEWSGPKTTGRWLIESADVACLWHPLPSVGAAT